MTATGREPSAVKKPHAQRIVDAYFSREHFDDRDGCCPLIGMTSDVQRGGETVKAAYRRSWSSCSRSSRIT
jgi:TetR/AcrR family transcriptional regulator, transcriptional repressor for nem operon